MPICLYVSVCMRVFCDGLVWFAPDCCGAGHLLLRTHLLLLPFLITPISAALVQQIHSTTNTTPLGSPPPTSVTYNVSSSPCPPTLVYFLFLSFFLFSTPVFASLELFFSLSSFSLSFSFFLIQNEAWLSFPDERQTKKWSYKNVFTKIVFSQKVPT